MTAVQHLTGFGIPQQRLQLKANQFRLPPLEQRFSKGTGRSSTLKSGFQPGHSRIKHQRLGRRPDLPPPVFGRFHDGRGFSRLGPPVMTTAVHGRPSGLPMDNDTLDLSRLR